MSEGEFSSILRLEVDTQSILHAAEAANLISQLAMAYDDFQHSPTVPAEARGVLGIFSLRTGSLFADFMLIAAVAGAIVALDECRLVMVNFVRRLRRLVEMSGAKQSDGVKASEQALINAMTKIITRLPEARITVYVHGDNSNFFFFDGETINTLGESTNESRTLAQLPQLKLPQPSRKRPTILFGTALADAAEIRFTLVGGSAPGNTDLVIAIEDLSALSDEPIIDPVAFVRANERLILWAFAQAFTPRKIQQTGGPSWRATHEFRLSRRDLTGIRVG